MELTGLLFGLQGLEELEEKVGLCEVSEQFHLLVGCQGMCDKGGQGLGIQTPSHNT